MTIYDILRKYNDSELEKIVLDYAGDISEFESLHDVPEEIQDEEAKATLKNGVLKITV